MNDLVRLPFSFEQKRNWKKAAAPAGAALLLVALGWGAGAKLDALRGPSPEQLAATAAQDSADKALRAEQAQKQEIATLRVHVDNLKSKLETQAQKTHESEAALTALQKTLADEKAQAQAATRELQVRIEKIQAQPKVLAQAQPQPAQKIQTQAQPRMEAQAQPRMEAQAQPRMEAPAQADGKSHALPVPPARLVDHNPTATIPMPATSSDPASRPPIVAAKLQDAPQKPYRAYVLRDVNDGVAVVEGEQGVEEVGPGDVLPGGARVQRIERRGRGWVVVTDRGFIAPERESWYDRMPAF